MVIRGNNIKEESTPIILKPASGKNNVVNMNFYNCRSYKEIIHQPISDREKKYCEPIANEQTKDIVNYQIRAGFLEVLL